MPRVLFILGKYFPKSSANGVCCKNIVDECKRQGINVTCIINGDVTRPNHEYIDGVEVYRIKPRLHYRILDWCEYNPKSILVRPLKIFANILNKIQLAVMSPFWPLVSPLYTYRFYKQGKKLIETGNYDIIVSAYTPIDSAYAGYLLKNKYPNIKYITYYLDALAGGWGPSSWSHARKEKHLRYWEQKFNSKADIVISMLSAKHYHEENPIDTFVQRVFLDVPTFVESEVTSVCKNDNNKKIALYAGSINYPQRNPVPLLDAFTSFSEESNIELHIIGPCNCEELLHEYSKKSNGRIKYLGTMSHDDILQKEANADFLINFGDTNPYTIPSKIFEYMQFRKPIISSKSIDNEAALCYLDQYGSSFIFDERIAPESSSKALFDYIMSNPIVADADYAKIFYKNTPKAFCDIIKSL